MQEFIRFTFLLLVTLLVLFSLVQCRSVFTETMGRQKRSLSSMCLFRKSRLCDYLSQMESVNSGQKEGDQELWKRGVSRFYSNW